ncbi:MAG: metal-dependent transcriptional regulator [Eubacterium sp.]|nr:metal-dependent transcriptional regulator [Eubacterium sp.]MBR7061070.1 metal-dependent transcriptional regulator [Eubacterium sp.]
METKESSQMYLETIYVLSQKSDSVRKIDVSKHMGFAKPSVTRGIGLLEKQNLVSIDGAGNIFLTEEGEKEAKRIYERHTVLTELLIYIGVDEKVAADDACRVEHYISDETFNAIKKHMKKCR